MSRGPIGTAPLFSVRMCELSGATPRDTGSGLDRGPDAGGRRSCGHIGEPRGLVLEEQRAHCRDSDGSEDRRGLADSLSIPEAGQAGAGPCPANRMETHAAGTGAGHRPGSHGGLDCFIYEINKSLFSRKVLNDLALIP